MKEKKTLAEIEASRSFLLIAHISGIDIYSARAWRDKGIYEGAIITKTGEDDNNVIYHGDSIDLTIPKSLAEGIIVVKC